MISTPIFGHKCTLVPVRVGLSTLERHEEVLFMCWTPHERECSISTGGVPLAVIPTPLPLHGGGHRVNDGAAPDGCGGHTDH